MFWLRCKHVKFETGIYRIRDFVRWTRDLSHVTLSQSSLQLVYTGSDNFEHWIRKGRSLTTSTAGQDKDANALLLQNVWISMWSTIWHLQTRKFFGEKINAWWRCCKTKCVLRYDVQKFADSATFWVASDLENTTDAVEKRANLRFIFLSFTVKYYNTTTLKPNYYRQLFRIWAKWLAHYLTFLPTILH